MFVYSYTCTDRYCNIYIYIYGREICPAAFWCTFCAFLSTYMYTYIYSIHVVYVVVVQGIVALSHTGALSVV